MKLQKKNDLKKSTSNEPPQMRSISIDLPKEIARLSTWDQVDWVAKLLFGHSSLYVIAGWPLKFENWQNGPWSLKTDGMDPEVWNLTEWPLKFKKLQRGPLSLRINKVAPAKLLFDPGKGKLQSSPHKMHVRTNSIKIFKHAR